jgi:hypothetical protein
MLVEQFAAAVAAARTQAQLDEIARLTWRAHAEAQLSDIDAEAVAEAIQARRAAFRSPPPPRPTVAPPAPRHAPRSPDKQASLERRRRQAASGALPPQIAAQFTMGEAAALAVVAREVQKSGRCAFPIDALAALAGVSRSTVKNAVRQAKALGFIEVTERRRAGQPNLTNIIKITAPPWRTWLKIGGRMGGGKNLPSTDTRYFQRPVEKIETEKFGDIQQNLEASSGALGHSLLSCSLWKAEDGAEGCKNTKQALSA